MGLLLFNPINITFQPLSVDFYKFIRYFLKIYDLFVNSIKKIPKEDSILTSQTYIINSIFAVINKNLIR